MTVTDSGDFAEPGQSGTRSVLLGTGGTATLSVTTDDDDTAETHGRLIATVGTGMGYSPSGTHGSVSITVRDDDGGTGGAGGTKAEAVASPPAGPQVRFSTAASRAAEGTVTQAVTVNLSPAPIHDLTIQYTVSGSATAGEDFRIDPAGQVTVPAGFNQVSIPVRVLPDSVAEEDETLILTLVAGPGYVLEGIAQHTVTLFDPPQVRMTVGSLSVSEGEAIVLALHVNPPQALMVDLGLSETDGDRVDPGEEGLRTVSVPVSGVLNLRIPTRRDARSDQHGTVTAILHPASGYHVVPPGRIDIRLRDNDRAVVDAGRHWLVRYGRTVAEQGLDSIADRLNAVRTPGTRATVGGIGLTVGSGAVPARDDPDPQAIHGLRAVHAPANTRTLSGPAVRQGSHFIRVGERDAHGGSLAFWGRAAESDFDGRESLFTLSGEATTVLLGADYAYADWLMGGMLLHSEGDGAYRQEATPGTRAEGEISTSLTALVPYMARQVTESVQIWGALGQGAGTLTLVPVPADRYHTDMDWTLAAGGLRSDLMRPPADTGLSLALVADALWVRTDADRIGGLSVSSAHVSRLRLGVEGRYAMALESGTQVVPMVEIGIREDDGDAETGAGLEIGGGMTWSDPRLGLSLELAGRTLVMHDARDFEDRGFSVSLDYEPRLDSPRGLRLSLRQTMGMPAGGLAALFAADPLATRTDGTTSSHLTLEAAYGFAVFSGRFIGAPYTAFTRSHSARDVTIGWRLTPAARRHSLAFGVRVLRREPDHEASEQAALLDLIARW